MISIKYRYRFVRRVLGAAVAGAVVIVACAVSVSAAPLPSMHYVSLNTTGDLADGSSHYPSISASGRYVSFLSYAQDLVAVDANPGAEFYRRDLVTNETTRVSQSSFGVESTGDNIGGCVWLSDISSDGRFVVFTSLAASLTAGDTNGLPDVLLRDIPSGVTKRITRGYDRAPANGESLDARISDDGTVVVYSSGASNLVEDDVNGTQDVFAYGTGSLDTTLVSVSTGGEQANNWSETAEISGNGRYAVFVSMATNLDPADTDPEPDIYLRDMVTGVTELVSVGIGGANSNGQCYGPSVSDDGRYVSFNSDATNLVTRADANGVYDTFVRDRLNGTTTMVSVSSDGAAADEASGPTPTEISGDGRYVMFISLASTLASGGADADWRSTRTRRTWHWRPAARTRWGSATSSRER
jgi:Tol biopolymer transport system component